MRMTDLPLDLVGQRLIRVVPLDFAGPRKKGGSSPSRPATARSIAAYLRSPPLSPPGGLAVRLAGAAERRAARRDGPVPDVAEAGPQAGYEPAVHPHMFRHLSFAMTGSLAAALSATWMPLAGWRTRSMVDRYGADMADQRARDAKRRMGDRTRRNTTAKGIPPRAASLCRDTIVGIWQASWHHDVTDISAAMAERDFP